ncbi:MAG: DNA polymerase III subunit delta', partial [Bacillota bacterium]
MAFADIPDQEKAKKLIKNQLNSERLSHAYLFLGPEDVGQIELAKTMAKTYFCEIMDEDSCEECTQCIKVRHSNHPDFDLLEAEENKDQIGIDLIRDLQKRIAYRPYEAKHRFFIISGADKMTEQAANSLLKTLEEPPDYATLVLIAEDESKVLPTILSRCQQIRFEYLSDEILISYFKRQGIKDENIKLMVRLAKGSLVQAKNIIDNKEIFKKRTQVFQFLLDLADKSRVEVFREVDKWKEWYGEGLPLFDLLIDWYRDIIVVEDVKNGLVNNDDYLRSIVSLRNKYTRLELIKELDLIREVYASINANVKIELALQYLLLKLRIKRCKYEESSR